MSTLPIITLPDPLLRQKSTAIERVDGELQRLIDDMLETMYEAPGIGLAAIQVGVPRRLIVLDVADHEKEPPQPLVMVNPQILQGLAQVMKVATAGMGAALAWPALLRKLDRMDPSYKN